MVSNKIQSSVSIALRRETEDNVRRPLNGTHKMIFYWPRRASCRGHGSIKKVMPLPV